MHNLQLSRSHFQRDLHRICLKQASCFQHIHKTMQSILRWALSNWIRTYTHAHTLSPKAQSELQLERRNYHSFLSLKVTSATALRARLLMVQIYWTLLGSSLQASKSTTTLRSIITFWSIVSYPRPPAVSNKFHVLANATPSTPTPKHFYRTPLLPAC